jgi:hypothetical protein
LKVQTITTSLLQVVNTRIVIADVRPVQVASD